MSNVVRTAAGIATILAGLAATAYVSIGLLFVGGIVDIVDGAKADPTNGGRIVWGIFQVMPLAELSAVGILLPTLVIGGLLLGKSFVKKPRRLSRTTAK